MLHEFRLINVRSENNETISFVYGAKSFRSHWNVGAVYIAPKITIAGNMEDENSMGSGTTSEYCARLLNSILKALNMPDLKVTLWSDSTTALWWIKEYGNWSVFVANRVKEIRQLTQIQSWKTREAERDFCDLPIRRDEESVVGLRLVFFRRRGRGSLSWIEKKKPYPGLRELERRALRRLEWKGRKDDERRWR
ncbi:integrase catalytic domain-containing protein [Trichonephila clavipes]|nr:integrase catalytic domain-containing protein [Trichonephila clavipes]